VPAGPNAVGVTLNFGLGLCLGLVATGAGEASVAAGRGLFD
jgi:hypothetical protein